jgi:DNA-binding FadR family transcriptional regulator
MTKVNFQPLKIRRLSEIVEESIRGLIISGQLKTGSRLPTETEIGRQFGVSTVTVREALRGLEAFGVIQKKRGKDGGIFVSQTKSDVVKSAINNFLSLKDCSAEDISVVRMIVEPATIAIAVSQITPAELDGLEENISHCEKKLERAGSNFSDSDFFYIEERNVEFHRLIGEATHNAVLALTVDYVEDFMLSFKRAFLKADVEFTVNLIQDHRNIYNALKERDEKTAEQRMFNHIQIVENYLASKKQDKPENQKINQGG